MINALILSVTLAGVANPTHVQCHLWKRLTAEKRSKRFVFIGLQRDMVVWVIITLRRVFLSVRRYLVVFMRGRTSDLACRKY